MLNPNLVEMIKYAKEGIKDVAFLTNAELLTEKRVELVESGLDWISISAMELMRFITK